jgi:hypothetical protein
MLVALARVKLLSRDMLRNPACPRPFPQALGRQVLGGACLHLLQPSGARVETLYEFWWFTSGIFLVMVALKQASCFR